MQMPQPEDEEARLRAAVAANPRDFDAHTGLLALIERNGEAGELKKETLSFLARWPLCYGFWKKLADFEAGTEGDKAARAVYEQALEAFPNGVELWVNYCAHVAKHAEIEETRQLFERAAQAVGGDPTSEKLWDKWLEYETVKEAWPNVQALFQRIIGIRLNALERYWESFKQYLPHHPPTLEEGETPESFNSKWDGVYKAATLLKDKCAPYETAIKRGYFHVRPLDEVQLQNWREYLTFMEAQVSDKDSGFEEPELRQLYERCLVPCCKYPEIWKRYVNYLIKADDRPKGESTAERALAGPLSESPEMHWFVAELHEEAGRIEQARAVHKKVAEQLAPGLVQATVNLANFERRQAKPQPEVRAIYEAGISAAGSPNSKAHLSLHLARYLSSFCGAPPAECREVFQAASESSPGWLPLWEGWLHWEGSQPDSVQHVQKIVGLAVGAGSQLDADGRQQLWEWYLEYLTAFGSSLSQLEQNVAAFEQQFPGKQRGKKRGREAEKIAKAEAEAAALAAQQAYMQQYYMQQQQMQMKYQQQQQQQQEVASAIASGGQPPAGAGPCADNPLAEACGDYKRGMCHRARCRYSHQIPGITPGL